MSKGRAVLRSLLVDVGIALAALVAAEIGIATGREEGSVDRDWLAYALGVAMAAPLLLRRRFPVGVLYAVSAVLLLFYSLNYPGFPPALVIAVPLYDAARAGRLWWAVPVPVFFLSAGAVALIAHRGDSALDVLAVFLPEAAVVAVAVLLGALVRSRAAYAAEVRLRLEHAERERELEAQRRVSEERLRIARDLHDTVGHAIATITVQSAAAMRLLDRDPQRSRAALEAIRDTGRAALTEMRSTLGVLRAGDAADDPAAPLDRDAGLQRLPALVTAVRAAGLRVEVDNDLDSSLDGRRLPGPVDQVAYRVLQEALTNVLRHAGQQADAEILLRAAPHSVTVEVSDNGSGPDAVHPHDPGGGRGLKGMRERVERLGGRLIAGPRPGGGFQVRAVLPRTAPEEGEMA